MTTFDIVGTLNSILFVLCLSGLMTQIRKIILEMKVHNREVTAVLSLNQFSSSYLSFYGFFIFSFLIDDINLFLFWTRFFACVLTLAIIFLIAFDRRNVASISLFIIGILSLILAMFLYHYKDEVDAYAKNAAIGLIVVSTILLIQGGMHQISKIRRDKSVGVLSYAMNFFFFLKDMSNVAFGLVMGFADGWPLIFMVMGSGSIKGAILYQFSWVKKLNKSKVSQFAKIQA